MVTPRVELTDSSPLPHISTHTIHTCSNPALAVDLLTLSLLGWSVACGGTWKWLGILGLIGWVKVKTGVVLSETILTIGGLGLQLSTTRGLLLSFPLISSSTLKIPISTSSQFLPLTSISDVVINEGIYGWTIIYYLVIIQHNSKAVKLHVGFPELLPRLDELLRVWIGVRHTLFVEEEERQGETGA